MTNYVTMPASVRTVTVNFIPNSTSSQILVVDEDNNDPDVLTYYTDALTALGKTYTVWNANNSDIEPYPSNLLNYETVIWFTGSDYGDYAGPSSFGETSLGSWLDNNGCFLLSSQDYLYAQELTVFGSTYLGINEYSDDVGQTVATGAGNVFGGLGPFTLNYPFTDYSDFVTPDGTSQIAFTGNNGSSAVFKNSGTYKTVFLGFPFEAIPTAADRQAVMSRFLNWCDQTTTTPVITSMNPISKQTQSGGFTLTVYGNNLTSDSHIYWNGTQLDTYYYGNRVLALINSSQLLHADIVEITVDDSASKPFYIYTFADVTQTHPLWRYVEGFFAREITTGCAVNPMRYCPDRAVTRGEMAVFLLRSMHVDDVTPYEPADDPADPFADVPTPGKDWMEPWIEQFYATGITTGCGVNPLRYCPERNVSRGEMAVFLLRAKHGSSYTPPPATGTFADVPTSNWMAAWIEQFYKEGITTGCAVSPLRYCPDRSVNRAEMATFVDRAFGFPALP